MTTEPVTTEQVREIPLDQLVPHPDNPRRKVQTTGPDWKQFVASIQAVGILEPLIVRPLHAASAVEGVSFPETFEIVAGHRRHSGAQVAGLTTAPCLVRTLSDQDVLVNMLVENLQRVDLDPVEEATGYFRLVETGMTQADMAEKVGRSKKHVADRIKMLGAGADILAKVKTGDATIDDALEFAKVTDDEIRTAALELFRHRGDAAYAIQRANDRVVQARRRAKVVESATKKGYEIFDAPSAWNNVPPKHKALDDLGINPGDAQKHGITVVASVSPDGKVLLVTPDVTKARKAVGGGETDEQREAKEREKEAKRKEREAAQLRDAKLGVLAREKASVSDLLAEAAAFIRANIGSDRAHAIGRLLDLEPVQSQGAPNWLKTIEQVSDKVLVRCAYLVDLRARDYSPSAKKQLAALLKDVVVPESE